MRTLWTDAYVRRFLWDDRVISEAVAAAALAASADDFVRHGFGLWGLFDRSTGELIGFCGLRSSGEEPPELLYGLLPSWSGRGVATEAARVVLTYAFTTLALPRVVAATDVPNAASVGVMERLGMRFERRGELNGLDTLFYSIAREDFDIAIP